MARPEKILLRAFNVGFGDCFLLSFNYANNVSRHVLIDYGSTALPKGAKPGHMLRIARKIGELTNNKLHVVVATHRHRDHISGFATSTNGKGSGDIIKSYKPDVVLQPWTEQPDIPVDATGPRAFALAIRNMNSFAGKVHKFASSMTDAQMRALGYSARERDHLSFIGENNIANLSAIKNLMGMGRMKAKYLFAGAPAGLTTLLPGVTVDVMGPPTVDQHPEAAKQNPKNLDEYWHLAADNGTGMTNTAKPHFPEFVATPPLHAKWIAARLAAMQKQSLLSMVRDLDKAMNNTSLILLFRVGGKSLLFPGDAQWENWQYALTKKPEWVALLKKVDLYKVGHHGSLNATPKSLWKAFENKSTSKTNANRLTSVMSTSHGVHGESDDTSVPGEKLVTALEHESHHHSTETVDPDKLYDEIEIVI